MTRALVAAMRVPAPLLPGWFPLVVERVHRFLGPRGEHDVEVDGFQMTVDVGEYIQRRLFYRCHEPHESRLVQRLLRPGDVFVDVGAHVGFFTLIGAARVGDDGHVYAFEPVPANYSTLERNIRQNNVGNVTVNRAAVTDRSGNVKLGLDEERLVGKSTGDFTIGGAYGPLDAQGVSLDDYLAQVGESRPLRLVKMDVEGLEPQVLAGAERTLDAMTPDAILFEQNAALLRRRGHEADAVTSRLQDRGYALYRVTALGRLRHVDDVSADASDDSTHRSVLVTGLATRQTLFNVLAVRPGVLSERVVRA
ncbi:MAG TPA: FkbM family methyltransferase [Actinomycetota bacterium]|nr:FkbM family methyltransferase [Actinomycetota bacterium]